MKHVEIYTTPTCPYCIAAKALLNKKRVSFVEIDVSADRSAMIARTGGPRSVPQIFIGDMHVGGCDDLHALETARKLDPLLAD